MFFGAVVIYFTLHYLLPFDNERLYLIFIEIIMSLSIISILMAVAMPNYIDYLEKARNLNSLSEISTLKVDASLYYAIHGEWPKEIKFPKSKTQIFNWSIDEALLTATRIDNKQSLSFKPFIPKSENEIETDIVLWVCGSYINGLERKYRKTVPPEQLVAACTQIRS